ncbi:hypothetical protein [Vibrio crassostreae]|uniref:hypothetical protein n=1 Tax=Vibrio crassostreae TaxID=246167 RepID=UPI000F4D6356|nr:hypothetical protein [Vibrio crassostreae]RPF00123.1 hypothetical protein EDB17_4001 [Vibrio crassostreae]
MKILFSLPVHEKQDCVDDLIDNIIYFVKKPVIILHVSEGFDYKLQDKHRSVVHINPVKIKSGFLDGSLSIIHILNLMFVKEKIKSVDYFMPISSNQLFVKKDIERYLINYSESKAVNQSLEQTDFAHYPLYKKDKFWKRICEEKHVYKVSPEGTFYKYSLVKEIIDYLSNDSEFNKITKEIYMSDVGLRRRRRAVSISKVMKKIKLVSLIPSQLASLSYASEEIVLPTLFKKNIEVGDKVCFLPWGNNLAVSIEDVDNLRKTESSYFSVKRVDREYNDEVRVYIRSLMNE